jgi:glycosyltransferase involved in cell wall biosynthesis
MAALSDQPLFSLAIPMHGDRAPNVLVLVASLLRDPGRDFEVLVVDNHSPLDPSGDFSAIVDERFRFVRNATDVGMVANWNRCVEVSRGRWIAIVHSDDQLVPNAINTIRSAINTFHREGMICFPGLDDFGRGRVIDRNTCHPKEPECFQAGADAGIFLFRNAFYCSGIIVSRGAYEQIGGFDEALRYSADEEFWLRVAASFPIYYDPTRICVYRRGEANSMMGMWKQPDFVELYRQTTEKAVSHFQAVDERAYCKLKELGSRRLRKNWLTIAFLCLCDGNPRMAAYYLDQRKRDSTAFSVEIRERVIRLLVGLPTRVSQLVCSATLKLLTSRLASLGASLVPR